MNRKIFLMSILFLSICLIFCGQILAWDDGITHKDLSEYATENSVLSKVKGNYLKSIGIDYGLDEYLVWGGDKKKVRDWFLKGAEMEDSGSKWDAITGKARFNNHFHNPLKPWDQAGLDDWIGPLHYTGESSLLWAQDGNKQQSIVQYGGNWSWQKTSAYFYTALISTSDTFRQENFAKTFRGLGQQMHLLQDTAVPDHVRNDAHPEDALFGKSLRGNPYFESWAKNDRQRIIDLAANPVFPNLSFNVSNGLAPVTQLFDTDTYDGLNAAAGINQGLSEYTNSNFFSNDTLFAAEIYSTNDRHYFPYPKKTSTDIQSYIDQIKSLTFETAEDGIEDKGIWIKKERDGESTINHFVRAGRWTSRIYDQSGESTRFYNSFYRDDKCHEDYASLLVPRAVGYSAGLLDYFFRGSIDITVPSNGVYSLIDATQPGFDPETTDFTSIKLRAKNTTANNEEMTNGTIQLVVKYKVAHTDPFQSGPVETDTEFSYIVVPEKNGISSLSRSAYTELNFDLSQNPFSLWATDVYLQVVYKGTLGNEENSVAVGFKDIGEPTPMDMFNNMDMICLYDTWYVAGSQDAIDRVDTNHNGQADEWDVFAHDLTNVYMRILPFGTAQYASPSVHNIAVPSLLAGHFLRAAYFLGDYQYYFGDYSTVTAPDANDHRSHSYRRALFSGESIRRQRDYTEGSGYVDNNPQFVTFRGLTVWGSGEVWDNPAPAGSACLYVDLP